MLIVDINTLHTINTLYFLNQIILHSLCTADCKNVMRIYGTFCNSGTGFDFLTFFYSNAGTERNQIRLLVSDFIVGYNNMTVLFDFLKGNYTADFTDNCKMFWFTSFKQFFNTRQTLCNIFRTCNTACVECSHGQLSTRFTDRLCCNNTNCLTNINRFSVCQVGTVTFFTNTVFCCTVKNRTNFNFLNAAAYNDIRITVVHQFIFGNQYFAGCFIYKIMQQVSAYETFGQRFNGFFTLSDIKYFKTFCCSAIVFTDNHFLRNVYQTTGQVTGVSCSQSGISQTFTSTTRGNKVFQNVQAFTIVCTNRNFDGSTGGIGNQTTHTGKLTNLTHGTTGAGICHHKDWIVTVQIFLKCFCNIVCCFFPCLQNHVVTLCIGQQTHIEFICDFINLLLCFCNQLFFRRWNGSITYSNGNCTSGGIFIALCFYLIQNFGCFGSTVYFNTFVDNSTKLFFTCQEADFIIKHGIRIRTVHIAQILRNWTVEDNTSHGGIYQFGNRFSIYFHGTAYFNFCMEAHCLCIVCHQSFIFISEDFAFTRLAVFFQSQIIGAQNHVLCRNCNRASVGRFQQVACCQHQETSFCLCFGRQRNVNCHLVTVEVSVISSTHKRMQF